MFLEIYIPSAVKFVQLQMQITKNGMTFQIIRASTVRNPKFNVIRVIYGWRLVNLKSLTKNIEHEIISKASSHGM